MVAVGVPSFTVYESVEKEKRGALSTIFSAAVGKLPRTPPPVGLDSVSSANRSPVAAPSLRTVTVNVLDVSLAPNVSVPEVAT